MVSLNSVPGKLMEQLILENYFMHRNKVIKSSKHRFTKGKVRLDKQDSIL